MERAHSGTNSGFGPKPLKTTLVVIWGGRYVPYVPTALTLIRTCGVHGKLPVPWKQALATHLAEKKYDDEATLPYQQDASEYVKRLSIPALLVCLFFTDTRNIR